MIQIGETEEEDNQSERCKSENMERSKLMKKEKSRDKLKDSYLNTESASSLVLGIVKAGLSSKSSVLDPSSWAKLMVSLDGRDKITKIIQYSSRFLAYYTQQKRFSNQNFQIMEFSRSTRYVIISVIKIKIKLFLRNVYYNIRSNFMSFNI